MICIDLRPYTTARASDRNAVLDVGGFSDTVFGVVADFLAMTAAASWPRSRRSNCNRGRPRFRLRARGV